MHRTHAQAHANKLQLDRTGVRIHDEDKDSGTTYCPKFVGCLQMATTGIPDENFMLQYPSEHDC